MTEPVMTERQRQLSAARKQIQQPSSLQILRRQVAAIETIVNTMAGQLRLLTDAVNASNSVQAHRDDQALIQDQARRLASQEATIRELNDTDQCTCYLGMGNRNG